jgi:serine/threonine protein phosphatase PrpC
MGWITWSGATDQGRSRENNEDAWHVAEQLQAAILADGIGGQECGEVGSAVTIEGITEYLRAPEPGLTLEGMAKEAIRAANRRVLEAARERPGCSGMGSTVVLTLWRPPEILIANAGDSRAYLCRAGALRQLSYDQNFANELRTQLGFSEERVRAMPNGSVLTMAVGSYPQVQVRTHTETLESGDQILLCSDGLHGPVDEDTIARILSENSTLNEKVGRLIDTANENGGPDNVTAVVLQYEDEAHG